mmetsp:Transcript_18266/g.58121  ORF Transcript_18266/g.58121 Transcript_18266/m.58121 type:complete len:206 (-) Transcript_18266:397-1014(-)
MNVCRAALPMGPKSCSALRHHCIWMRSWSRRCTSRQVQRMWGGTRQVTATQRLRCTNRARHARLSHISTKKKHQEQHRSTFGSMPLRPVELRVRPQSGLAGASLAHRGRLSAAGAHSESRDTRELSRPAHSLDCAMRWTQLPRWSKSVREAWTDLTALRMLATLAPHSFDWTTILPSPAGFLGGGQSLGSAAILASPPRPKDGGD